MLDSDSWADSQHEKLERIRTLLNELADNHARMQQLLRDAFIKVQAERGIDEIEAFLKNSDR